MNRCLLITGLSGAGKTQALKTLEDLGYEAVDNAPLPLVPELVQPGLGFDKLALGLDVRSRHFSAQALADLLMHLRKQAGWRVEMLFLTCDDEVLRRRFSETRRRHPLATDRHVLDGIALERRILNDCQELTDHLIDTSHLHAAEFRELLKARFGDSDSNVIALTVMSFAYRHGLPREADMVWDVRFLRNPHYEAHLRPMDGRQPEVAAYVAADADYAPFVQNIQDMLALTLPRYGSEGKHYLTLAFGCTGGKHRSVAVAEQIAGFLRELGYNLRVVHRDAEREV